MQLKEFKDWLTVHCSSPKTIDSYYNAIYRFYKKYNIINQENIYNYIKYLVEQNKSRAMINQFIFAVKKYCLFKNLNFDIPKPRKPQQKIKPYLTEDELKETCKKIIYITKKPDKYRAILQFLFYTGLRREELVNLKRKDIDLDNCIVSVQKTKTNFARKVIFPKKIITDLKSYFLREREEINAFNITYQSVYDMLKKIGQEMGLKDKFNPHAFRHSSAHYLLKITKNDLRVVQKILGHVNLTTTTRYVDINNEEAINIVKNIYKNH